MPTVPVKTVRFEVASTAPIPAQVTVLAGGSQPFATSTTLPWSGEAAAGQADLIGVVGKAAVPSQILICRIFFDGVLVAQQEKRGGVVCPTRISFWNLDPAGAVPGGALGTLRQGSSAAPAAPLPVEPRTVVLTAVSDYPRANVRYTSTGATTLTDVGEVSLPFSVSLPWSASQSLHRIIALGSGRTDQHRADVVTCAVVMDGVTVVLARGRGTVSCSTDPLQQG